MPQEVEANFFEVRAFNFGRAFGDKFVLTKFVQDFLKGCQAEAAPFNKEKFFLLYLASPERGGAGRVARRRLRSEAEGLL